MKCFFYFLVFISFFLKLSLSGESSHQNHGDEKQRHILFIIGGGSHVHPTFEIVRCLIDQQAKVTYIVFDKTHRDAISLTLLGAEVLELKEELFKINQNFIAEQQSILLNASLNYVDQPEGVLDTSILSQYFMAQFWDELLVLVQTIKPDVILYDTYLTYWGNYVARALKIPAFMSFAPAFSKEWEKPNVKELMRSYYYQTELPATKKRLWAASYLKEKLGSIADDIDVDFPLVFADKPYATFVYTYSKLENYSGHNFLDTNLFFAGYPDNQAILLNEKEKKIADHVAACKGNKKLVFISMGTDSSKPLEFFEMLGEALGNGGSNQQKNQDLVVALHPGQKIARVEGYLANEVAQLMENMGHTNFIVYDYFPLPYLFKMTDLFIGNGGNNLSMQALKNYIPVIFFPINPEQKNTGDKFSKLDLGVTIPDAINVMSFKDNNNAWKDFTYHPNKRAAFVKWVRENVTTILEQSSSEHHTNERRDLIDSLLQGEEGYKQLVDLILNPDLRPLNRKLPDSST